MVSRAIKLFSIASGVRLGKEKKFLVTQAILQAQNQKQKIQIYIWFKKKKILWISLGSHRENGVNTSISRDNISQRKGYMTAIFRGKCTHKWFINFVGRETGVLDDRHRLLRSENANCRDFDSPDGSGWFYWHNRKRWNVLSGYVLEHREFAANIDTCWNRVVTLR